MAHAKKGVKPIELGEKEWQRLAMKSSTMSAAAQEYLKETNTNSLTDAFAAVRKFHAEHMGKMHDFELRR